MGMLCKIEKLRAEALREAMDSPAFATVRALDNAVVSEGGKSLIEPLVAREVERGPNIVASAVGSLSHKVPKVPQGKAAELALLQYGPLPVGSLMQKSVEKGAKVSGKDPLTSFRSMLSRDQRFYSLQRNNMYLWWLTGVGLPEGFMPEPENESDLRGSGTHTSTEGGDSHAATMS